MAERLGNVLYWIGLASAGLLCGYVVLCMYIALTGGVTNWIAFLDPWAPVQFRTLPTPPQAIFFALVSWLLGRAARYVLSGR